MKALDGTKLESPRQIEVGSFLVEAFANSLAFYKVLSTTDKSVVLQRVHDKQTRFENAGGPTGYRYCAPTDRPYSEKKVRKIARPSRSGETFIISGPIGKAPMALYDPSAEYSEYYE